MCSFVSRHERVAHTEHIHFHTQPCPLDFADFLSMWPQFYVVLEASSFQCRFQRRSVGNAQGFESAQRRRTLPRGTSANCLHLWRLWKRPNCPDCLLSRCVRSISTRESEVMRDLFLNPSILVAGRDCTPRTSIRLCSEVVILFSLSICLQ